MNELTALYSRIDAAINEIVDIDLACSKLTGRSVGFRNIKDMKHELANNARKAVYSRRAV